MHGLIEPQQALAAVDTVLQSNRGGRVILKQALITTKFFKDSLGPVLGKARSDLKELLILFSRACSSRSLGRIEKVTTASLHLSQLRIMIISY